MKIQDKHLDRKTIGHTGKRVESILQHSCLSSASASQKIKEAKWNVEKGKVKGMYVKCEQKKLQRQIDVLYQTLRPMAGKRDRQEDNLNLWDK